MRGSSGCSLPSRLNGDVTFRVFDGRVESTRRDPSEERDEHRGGLFGGVSRERVAPGLALLLDEPTFGHQTPKVVLGGLNRLKTKVLLYLAHGGRKTFQEALADELIDKVPGFPGRRFG